jgi:DNA-3-methyladenine glycosylase II
MEKTNPRILNHFKKYDKRLYSAVKRIGNIGALNPDQPKNYFYRLCRAIVGQQLADSASRTIFSRFEALFPGLKVSPVKTLKISTANIRKAGLSNAKAKYVKNLAKAVVGKKLNLSDFQKFSNEQVIDELTRIKGIGPWTAEMFLMFVLGREDVFSHGDLGLRNAMKKLYGFKREPTKEQIENITNKWSPYRTYACLVLWKTIDG